MPTILILVLFACLSFAKVSQAQTPVTVELAKDYGRKWDLKIDGRNVSGPNVLNELAKAKLSIGDAKIVVQLPSSVSIDGWSNIEAMVDKVGFLDAQYFALSDDGQKMVEIKRVGPAVPFSIAP
jgi:hypothetical protein